MSSNHVNEVIKHSADGVAGFVTVGAIIELLPPIAAAFTIAWTGLRIWIILSNRIRTGKWKD